MRRILGLSLAVLAVFGSCGVARAQMVSAANVASMIDALQRKGYRAELAKDESGDPMINSASSGTNFIILFYGCKKNENCTTVQFFAGFTNFANASLESLNKWNAENRFGRAYVSDRGAARLEMDLDLDHGGMSAALFDDNLELWTSVLANFEKHISGG